MRVCGLGGPELVILALLLFVVFGPERTQQVALSAGRLLRRAMKSEWWADFTRLTREIRNLPNTLVRLAELEETQAELEKTLSDLQEEIDINLQRDVTTEPWGIENAVAGSTPPEERPAPPPAQDAEDPDLPDSPA